MTWFWWLRRRTKTHRPPQAWVRAPQASAVASQRRYLADADYILPKDQEEHERLDFQHHALNLTLGNHYLAPLPPSVRVILDIGAGTVRRIGGR